MLEGQNPELDLSEDLDLVRALGDVWLPTPPRRACSSINAIISEARKGRRAELI